ncbi:MAG: ATPase domain-containing protein [Nanoarchaeota archaeon]|nr:ATPase domain-containing protein [Nanoarchaeota archaeon]
MKKSKHKISVQTGRLKVGKEPVTKEKGSEERVSTGIPGLDEVMSGGFEKNSINLISGGAGTGKSIFAMQFIINGITQFNEPGIYITFEEEKEKIQKHMQKMGWDLKKLGDEGKLMIIEYTPDKVKKMLAEGGGDIEWAMGKIKAKRIVIDSLTAFALLFKDELARREAFLDLFRIIEKWDCTALLVVEHEADLERHDSMDVEFEVDGIILLYYLRKGDIRNRALEILKLRGSEHASRIFPMKITDQGIKIYPDEAVF